MIENHNQTMSAQADKTLYEEFFGECYEFRHNVLSDKYEMRDVPAGAAEGEALQQQEQANAGNWRVVTREVINSIVRRIKRELGDESGLKTVVEEYIYSEETPAYDPIAEYVASLPAWDGKDRVRELFGRLPGIGEEQQSQLSVWFRSVMVHWLQLDGLHGNEQVVTLIGPQGCGKSTFCAQLLPPSLRCYYLDHVNLGNKFDKEMALTSNLLVNIDELDQIKPGKQAELKQMLSKIKVNGRPIYGRAQQDRRRYASFMATTNNPRPLCDPTGSRRYLCVEIAQDSIICNDRPIDYPQLYAQVKYELMQQRMPYWFTPAEVRRIEEQNVKYQRVDDLEAMVHACFRRPEATEVVKPMLTREVVEVLARSFPELKQSSGMNVKVGRMLKAMNFERKENNKGTTYYLVPLQQSA